jgi:predicted transcriptional regulator
MSWRRWIGLLVVIPVASAGPLQADLHVYGAVTFQGSGQAEFEWTGAVHDARLAHTGAADGLVVTGPATLLTYRFAFETTPTGGPVGYTRTLMPLSEESKPLGIIDGAVLVTETGDNASTRLLASAPVPVAISGSFSLEPSRDLHEDLFYAGDAQPYEPGKATYPPFGAPLVTHTPISLQPIQGFAILTDQLLQVAGQEVDTRWTEESQSVAGLGTVAVRTTRLVLIEGTISATQAFGSDEWVHIVRSMTGGLDGDLLLANAQGSGVLNGTALPDGIHLFQAIGPLEATASFEEQAGRWNINGSPSLVAVNARAVGDGGLAIAAVAAVGLTALVLAALAKWGKALIGLLPGLNIAEPLGHRGRVQILATVAENPGIDQSELTAQSRLARGTVRHHLKILRRADLITERRFGSRLTYTLNSGSYDFQAIPNRELTAGEGLAILRHPQRRQLFEALQQVGEADFEILRGRLASQGTELKRYAASYHFGLLMNAGIVGRRREGRRIIWRPTLNLPSVFAEQARRFLVTSGMDDILRAVSTNPQALPHLYDDARGHGWKGTKRDFLAKLDLLVAIGAIQKTESGYGRTRL